jgi:hypothetical protein
MELIIHFGTHKTGSTSIQRTLHRNLRTRDVTYLHFGRANSSIFIKQAFGASGNDRPTHLEALTQAEIAAQTKRTREEIAHKIGSLSCTKAVLSAEVISQFKPHQINSLLDFLRPYASSIRAIGYVRSPKGYTESVIQQRVKRRPADHFERSRVDILYRRIIETFDQAIGKENVEVIQFDRRSLKNGCVVKDICARTGIAVRDEDIVNANESLTLPAFQLFYLLWKYQPDFYVPRIAGPRSLFKQLIGQLDSSEVRKKLLDKAFKEIASFPGTRIRLHSSAYQRIVNIDPEDSGWLEQRAGIIFDEDIHAHDDVGIKNENDILRVDQNTVRLLLEKLRLPESNAPKLMEDPRLLAEHVCRLVHR